MNNKLKQEMYAGLNKACMQIADKLVSLHDKMMQSQNKDADELNDINVKVINIIIHDMEKSIESAFSECEKEIIAKTHDVKYMQDVIDRAMEENKGSNND